MMPPLLTHPFRAALLRVLHLAALFSTPSLLTAVETNPLLGSWHFTGFENEVNSTSSSNPTSKPKFYFGALPFKTVEISEPSAGTLRLVLKRANGTIFETVERSYVREGDWFESSHTEPDTDGRERQLLGFRVIRDGLVLAQDIGAWFAADDTQIWDAWGFAGVLTKTPLPKTNAALWAGPYSGSEWIHKTDYNDDSGTHFLSTETGSLTFTLDKSAAGYRFTSDYASEEETDTGTAKVSGPYLAVDWQESGGTIWDSEGAMGTLLNSRGYNRIVQVSDRELVILGVSGDISRISPKPGTDGFQAYNAIDYADSAVIYLQSTATFVREGQAVSLAAPDTEIAGPFKAKGLPAGITIDAATGALTGLANVKPGNYAITRTAAGFSDIVYLRVESFPSALLANPDSPSKLVYNEYEALLRAPADNALVGKVTLKLAASGLFSGTLVAGSPKADALKGRLVPYYNGSAYYAAAALPLSGGRTLHLMIDADSLDAELEGLEGTTLGAVEAGTFSGRVRLFTAASPAPGGAAKGTVPYTLAFSLDSEPGSAPVGHGWATATINTAGALSLTGKLADGRPLTGTLRATSAGYLPYLKPYDKLPDAYLAGRLRLSARDGGGHHVASSEDGALVWSKPAPLNTSDRVPAFGPVTVSTRLEPWTKIVTAEEFAARLGTTGPAIAVVLSGGFSETDPARALPALLNFSVTKGKLASAVASPVLVEGDTTAAIAANTKAWAKVWKLSTDLSKGTFSGEFYLTDSVSAPTKSNPEARKDVSRKVPFSGVLVAGGGWPFAFGHYVVPSLEKNGPSLGGRIELSATSE
jgi:hypothetical protein